MSKIIAICKSEKKGTRKQEFQDGSLVVDFGLEGDAHAANWHRQISLLAKEKIDEFNEKGGGVVYGDFGENIVTEGIDFNALKIGDKFKLSNAILEITQFGKECHSHCEIFHRVGECIMPKLGVFAKVIEGGNIKVSDAIEIL